MRIVGGEFRGARLRAPSGQKTRPTSDRVRESLYNILAHSIDGFSLADTRVLDLFAGTGALGLEALSRGAAFCLFIDNDADARGAQRENIDALGVAGRSRLFRRDATSLGPCGSMGKFGLVFLDPPYGCALIEPALQSLVSGKWFETGAICVIEEAADSTVALPAGFERLDERTYGDSGILFVRAP